MYFFFYNTRQKTQTVPDDHQVNSTVAQTVHVIAKQFSAIAFEKTCWSVSIIEAFACWMLILEALLWPLVTLTHANWAPVEQQKNSHVILHATRVICSITFFDDWR